MFVSSARGLMALNGSTGAVKRTLAAGDVSGPGVLSEPDGILDVPPSARASVAHPSIH